MSTPVTGNSLGELVANARRACDRGPVFNLIAEGRYPFSELDSSFVRSYVETAELWQAIKPAPSLYITHGQYIHRYGDGVEYLIEQLLRKPTGNRAVLSLIDMKDLLGSADTDVRPSFMVFQAGFQATKKDVIYITMYFRALEVSRFLPVNLAEAGLLLKKVRVAIPEIETLHITVHAFRAYQDVDYNCLMRSELDGTAPETIRNVIKAGELRTIHSWLRSKLSAETVVETDALGLLRKELEDDLGFPDEFRHELDLAILKLVELASLRRTASHLEAIQHTKNLANEHIGRAMKILESMPTWK